MWVLLVPYSFVNWTSFGGKSCFYLYLSFEWPDLIFKGLRVRKLLELGRFLAPSASNSRNRLYMLNPTTWYLENLCLGKIPFNSLYI